MLLKANGIVTSMKRINRQPPPFLRHHPSRHICVGCEIATNRSGDDENFFVRYATLSHTINRAGSIEKLCCVRTRR